MATTTLKPGLRADTKKLTLQKLASWNWWLAGVYAVQGAVILLLSRTVLLPVRLSYPTADPLASEMGGQTIVATAVRHLFDINVAYLVAAFLFIPAIAHLLAATIYRRRFESEVKLGVARLRWIEYALSHSLMLLVIGLLSGIADLATLVLIVVLGLMMHMLGFAMEMYNQGKARPNWWARIIGCVADLGPWLAFAIYAVGTNIYGSNAIPGYVYWIYGTMFILFHSFAVNMYLQYAKVGLWKDRLYGERVYMLLGLATATVLAWLVFIGALRP